MLSSISIRDACISALDMELGSIICYKIFLNCKVGVQRSFDRTKYLTPSIDHQNELLLLIFPHIIEKCQKFSKET